MASEETSSSSSSDTTPRAKAKRDKLTIVIAVVGLVIAYLTLRKAGGSSSATPAGQAYTYPIMGSGVVNPSSAGSSGYDSGQIGQLSDALGQISTQIQDLPAAISSMAPVPAASTGAPSPGAPFVPSAPVVGTTAASSPPPAAAYQHINPGAGSTLSAAGQTIYAEPTPGVYVPAVVGGQWTAAGQAYRTQAGNPGLFVKG